MMNGEKLIECVRQFPELYDLANKRYSDIIYKENIWRKIQEEMGFPAEQCKKKWINLRDTYRRKIKQNKDTKSGQAAVNNKKWIYEDEMSFLTPFLKERNTVSNIQSTELFSNDESAVFSPTSQDTNAEDCSESLVDKTQITSFETQTTQNTNSAPQTQNPPKYVTPKKGIKRRRDDNTSASAVLMKYLIDKNQTETAIEGTREGTEANANEYFFKGIAKTVSTFGPINQNIIRSEIFSIVSQMELSELQQKQKQVQQNQEAMDPFSPNQSTSSSCTTYYEDFALQNL